MKAKQQDDEPNKRTEKRAAEKADATVQKATPPEVGSVRAKGSRHKKVTADKWNQ